MHTLLSTISNDANLCLTTVEAAIRWIAENEALHWAEGGHLTLLDCLPAGHTRTGVSAHSPVHSHPNLEAVMCLYTITTRQME